MKRNVVEETYELPVEEDELDGAENDEVVIDDTVSDARSVTCSSCSTTLRRRAARSFRCAKALTSRRLLGACRCNCSAR